MTVPPKAVFLCTADKLQCWHMLARKGWVALGMLMHFALTMLWRLATAGFRPRLRVHSLKANGGHIASIRS